MTKLVINRCFGGFGLSNEAEELYLKKRGDKCFFYSQTKFSYKDGCVEYLKVDGNDTDLFTYTSTIDHGDRIYKFPDSGGFYGGNIPRDDPLLVEVVEELGENANGNFARLEIVEIPDDVDWEIDEYDGQEHVAEKHRTW